MQAVSIVSDLFPDVCNRGPYCQWQANAAAEPLLAELENK
jgi:hypothetical protein